MGQFKPMVKMETTEPSVELKLKKGGHVRMKKGGKSEHGHKKMATGGGAMGALAGTPALIGRPAVNAPVQTPGKPSMAARRKAMMAKPATTPPRQPFALPLVQEAQPMKKGGKAEGGKSDLAQDKAMIKKAFKQHDAQEHKGGKGTSLKLKKGGKMATGGVTNGQGGYAKGGIINTEGQGGIYRNTKMVTDKLDHSPAKTRGVKDGNGGGYATGGVAKSNAGGYKKGGSAKKAYATGGKVDSGRPVAMPQGRKRVPAPVAISQLAGTYKNGGRATPAQARLLKNNATENASAVRQSKAQSNEAYSKYQKKMAEGGVTDREREIFDDMSKGAYDRHYADEMAENEAMGEAILGAPKRALSVAEQEALHRAIKEGTRPNQFGIDLQGLRREMQKRGLSQRDIDNMLRGQGATTDYERNIFGKGDFKDRFQHEYLPWKGDFFSKEPEEVELPIYKGEPPKYQNLRGKGAITQTERSVTVSPAGKKRGGRAC